MKWTTEQQKVIDSKNKNILVSAAAGSGKTAVLVERIISMISTSLGNGEDKGIDIDRLLIVTFTNAAASEMKERIEKAIERRLSENPENEHLRKQMSLIHNAQITTIHSFCLSVIRNNFHAINIDPAFRLVDEAELTLLKSDVVEEVLEKWYKEGAEEFFTFIESYASSKSDKNIEDLILELYNFSGSYPWPLDWLEEIESSFDIDSMDDMEVSPWFEFLIDYISAIISELNEKVIKAKAICMEVNGPYMYIDAIEADEDIIEELIRSNSYKEFIDVFKNLEFKRLSPKRDKEVSDDKKDKVKGIRDEIKSELKDIKEKYFFQSGDDMVEDIKSIKGVMGVLIKLVIDFDIIYKEKKRNKNIVDFNDLEHMALDILVKKEDGNIVPSGVATALSEYYEEIIIDEYQDSNYIQEIILNSVSKEKFGKPNVFMVGDVKQSIYKFRLARPELFMKKYDEYAVGGEQENEDYIRIDLHKNFRSRNEVLLGINFIFNQIMGKRLGNIEYDKEVALYEGMVFEKTDENVGGDIEVLIVDSDSELMKDLNEVNEYNSKLNEDEDSEYTKRELEARAIAMRIKDLVDDNNGYMVWDKNKYRKATYSDIVILTRAMSGWADVFVDILTLSGIPAHAESATGYFSTIEVKTILNLLRIIDNPLQDIPLAAVLKSPIVKLSVMEMAIIRSEYISSQSLENKRDAVSLYSLIMYYISKGIDENLKARLISFIERLSSYREWVTYIPIHEIIVKALNNTGYYNYISAMPSGGKRRANIDMLIQKAIQFEKTSYTGLFNFIRYIEKLEKYDVDFGEATVIGEKDNTVRIMSIHKSKGLEFPIVFLAGMGKGFNNMDLIKKIVIHSDLGLGPEYINHNLRIKAPTLIKRAIQKRIQLENLGEELRVLYVAMTRAKEKLIMIGEAGGIEKKIARWNNITSLMEEKLPFQLLTSAKTYFDLIMSALARHKSFSNILSDNVAFMNLIKDIDSGKPKLPYEESQFCIKIVSITELVDTEIKKRIREDITKDELLSWSSDTIYDERLRDIFNERLNYQYKYINETKLKGKLTVTELKKLSEEEQWNTEYTDDNLFMDLMESEKEIIPIIPRFMNSQNEITKAYRGTVYHKLLEIMDLHTSTHKEHLLSELDKIRTSGILTNEEIDAIDINQIEMFYNSNIVSRMRKADKKGKLFREKQFIMGAKGKELNIGIDSEEIILIQGTLDVYFEEDGEYVIVDYKTDLAKNKESLIDKYKTQLDYYQRALEQIYCRRVKEKVIYSFGLGEEILL